MTFLKAFLVEDSEVIRQNLVATLEELTPLRVIGFAEGGPDAVQWLSANIDGWDVVFIDIFLKRGSGLEVLRAAHALPGAKWLIVVSNYATADMRRKCLELGADRVFDKSNEIDELVGYCQSLATGTERQGP